MGGKKKVDFNLFSLTWIFTLFSIFGFLFEGFWSYISFGHWDNHYSLVWGPFTVIYGFAIVGLVLLFPILGKRNLLIQLFACFLLGSIFEFLVSFLQESIFGSRSWSYYHLPFNLNGRICLRMSIVWGLAGVFVLRLLAKNILRLQDFFKKPIFNTLGFVLFCFFIVNFTVSILATNRYSERHYGVEANSSLDHLFDGRFPDERMRRIYYNMEFTN